MKVLMFVPQSRCEKYSNPTAIPADVQMVFAKGGQSVEELTALAGDAEVIVVDAVLPIGADLIGALPKLKMIHSEGVAFSAIDVNAAKEAGVYVCNNRAVNAPQVAEHALMLMMAVQRRLTDGDAMVRSGRQMEAKTRYIFEGIDDMVGKAVGLVGFGAIGKELAKRLKGFDTELFYYDAFRASAETEAEYGITYLELEELYRRCDIISLHVPVTPETTNMINRETLAMMKPSAILINCARGAIVNSVDLAQAIADGVIYGAGLDTMEPEPVPADDPIVCLPEECRYRVVLSPHVAGTTMTVFKNFYRNIWKNIALIQNGEKPFNIVNGL